MQYIPAGNFQSRWWSCPREMGRAYPRAAAAGSAGSVSKHSERRNSIRMELEGSLQNWSCRRFQQILPRFSAAFPGQGLRGWPWKVSFSGTTRLRRWGVVRACGLKTNVLEVETFKDRSNWSEMWKEERKKERKKERKEGRKEERKERKKENNPVEKMSKRPDSSLRRYTDGK